MTVPCSVTNARSTVALFVLLCLGTPLLARSAMGSRREVEAVAASNATLELHSALFVETIRSCPLREAEVEAAERQALVARALKLFPSPENATPERLLEVVQECAERTGFHLRTICIKPGQPRPEVWIGEFREKEVSMPGYGTFDEVLRFLHALERRPTFARVTGFYMSPGGERPDDGLFSFAFTLRTVRFDPEGAERQFATRRNPEVEVEAP